MARDDSNSGGVGQAVGEEKVRKNGTLDKESIDKPVTEASADELIAEFDAERPARRLSGRLAFGVACVAAGLSVYALYWVFRSVPIIQYRMSFLAVVLPLTFLCYRPRVRRRAAVPENGGDAKDAKGAKDGATGGKVGRDHPGILDWALALLSLAVCVYPLISFDEFIRRTFAPTTLDVIVGLTIVLLVLEATRRTVGWILPAVCLAFFLYAYYGAYIPGELGHRGYDIDRIVVALTMGGEGVYGVPLDVAATYIILFTIYGAVLEYSGAGRFFVDVSLAAFRGSRTAPGRTVATAGFLLGTVSGSGVATTVSVGSVAWPILRRAGYPAEAGGGVLAASGIGAILSPPTLGAAAFIIAELLNVSYLTVLLYATIPTLLYYLGIFLAIEIDARRFGTREVEIDTPPLGRLLLRFGYHFSSLVMIVVAMALGESPFRAVVWATLLAFLLSFLDKRHRLTGPRTFQALAAGTTGVLPVAATTAAAGIIVAVTTLTGLGLKASSLIVDVSAGNLAITAVLCALAVLLLGLAVPVTASFVIAAVIVAPALSQLGVSPPEAYMFIFYYAVLSEVSPPTALSAVAASAVTGGDAFRTMMLTLKYTLPAFLVPFAFVLTPDGSALLGQGSLGRILLVTAVSAVAVAALAVATGGWFLDRARPPERVLCAVAAVLLLFLSTTPIVAGLIVLAAALAVHLVLRKETA
ncbi:TRAP transporter permease [Bailinhaonella thermotolerans]|uniref:TRAP transporter fused permease subunit n=1 Tax=Bailinhaonella thermotolerans TaxID=1070861 RepID=A0A3A4ALU8_9ACTN|nr:TRAP transporter fused permease subunit [Bailinhaonella thermotolerans]RJL26640.1 TRAP transporter fused permease subunit [Bailinhaonella thermotolerans]